VTSKKGVILENPRPIEPLSSGWKPPKGEKGLFAIFGNPVAHSLSPLMHNHFFYRWQLPACYSRYRLTRGEEIIKKFKTLHLLGANVTIPWKEYAYRLVDRVEGVAKSIGAVNTLVKEGNEVVGYNTDGLGLKWSLGKGKFQSILIIGAGGTAKSVAVVFPEAHILNRSPSRLHWFKERGFTCFSWEEFNPTPYQLVINTTSAGLTDNSLPAPIQLLLPVIKRAHLVVEAVYNRETPLKKLCNRWRVEYRDGTGMLVYQGVLGMELFLNRRLPIEEVANLYFQILAKGR